MGKHVYFERKYDAENTRRMLEEVTGQKVTLKKSSKGWYAYIDKAYLTKDGVAVSKGSVVYEASGAYEIADCDMSGESATVRLRPIHATEPDKDKDVREGILWYCGSETKDIMKRIESRHTFSNDIDGRNCIDAGDFIYIERRQTYYKVKNTPHGFQLSECEDHKKLTSLQCVEIIGDALRPINHIAERQKIYPLSSLYSRPLTRTERMWSKILDYDFEPADVAFGTVFAMIMITGIVAMLGCIVEYIS